MRTSLFIMFSFLLLNITAQNHFVGFKVGPNRTSSFINGDKTKKESRSGFAGGLTYEYLIDKHFSLGADLMWDQRGFSYRETILNFSGNPNLVDQINKYNYSFDYLSVPINAGFRVGRKLYGSVNLGLGPSFLMNGTTKTESYNLDGTFTGSITKNVFDRMNKFDFSGLFAISGGYKFKQRVCLFTSIAYHYSISSYSKSADTERLHNGIYSALGLKYAITSYNHNRPEVVHLKDNYYLKKSRTQKTTARNILFAGLGLAALGGITQFTHENSSDGGFNFTGAWMAIGGGCVSLVSVPFFISSGVNAQKAADLTFGEQQVLISQKNSAALISVPSASLKIKL